MHFYRAVIVCRRKWLLYSRLRPVKLNMPIWFVMWSQVPGVPKAWSLAFSWDLISKTLLAMVFTFSCLKSENENTLHVWYRLLFNIASCTGMSHRLMMLFYTYHSLKSSGEVRVMVTMRAPWDGGLDQVILTIFSIWERTRFRLSASRATTVRLPTRSSDGTKTCQS